MGDDYAKFVCYFINPFAMMTDDEKPLVEVTNMLSKNKKKKIAFAAECDGGTSEKALA